MKNKTIDKAQHLNELAKKKQAKKCIQEDKKALELKDVILDTCTKEAERGEFSVNCDLGNHNLSVTSKLAKLIRAEGFVVVQHPINSLFITWG